MCAVPAVAVDTADPGDSNPRAEREGRGGSIDDLANDLMAGNHRCTPEREVAFNQVQIGPADAAGAHAQEHVTGRDLGARYLGDL